jgi:hypothetical protein
MNALEVVLSSFAELYTPVETSTRSTSNSFARSARVACAAPPGVWPLLRRPMICGCVTSCCLTSAPSTSVFGLRLPASFMMSCSARMSSIGVEVAVVDQ